MLEKLFESLDKNIFTPDVINALSEKFNSAVEERVNEALAEKAKEFDTAVEERVNEALAEKAEEIAVASAEYKKILDEAFNESVSNFKKTINDNVEKSLQEAVDEFVTENRSKLDRIIDASRGEALLSVFERMNGILGKEISESLGKDIDNTQSEENKKLNAEILRLTNECNELKNQQIYGMIDTALEKINAMPSEATKEAVSERVHKIIDDMPDVVRHALSEKKIFNFCNLELSTILAESAEKTAQPEQTKLEETANWQRFI